MAALSTVAVVDGSGDDGVFITASHDDNPTLVLIALTLALPQTRIGQRVRGRTMMHLICCHHGCCHWCHLCLHLREDGAKDDSRGDRRGRHANIWGQKEVGHHDPIGVEQQKQN
jgi:hypothetical protein